ncbi:hypothetical protein HaLaN_22977, partial [Haematococcus lacustris]
AAAPAYSHQELLAVEAARQQQQAQDLTRVEVTVRLPPRLPTRKEVGSRGNVTQGGGHQGPRSLRVGTAADTYWCCLFRDDPAQLPPNPPTAYYLLPLDSDDV